MFWDTELHTGTQITGVRAAVQDGERSVLHSSLLFEPQAGPLARTGHTRPRGHLSFYILALELHPVRCHCLDPVSDTGQLFTCNFQPELNAFPAQGQAQPCQQPAAYQTFNQAKQKRAAITTVIGIGGEFPDFVKKAHPCKLLHAINPHQPKGTTGCMGGYSSRLGKHTHAKQAN